MSSSHNLTIVDPSDRFPKGGFICRVCHKHWEADVCSDSEAEDDEMQASILPEHLDGEAEVSQLRAHAVSEQHIICAQVMHYTLSFCYVSALRT